MNTPRITLAIPTFRRVDYLKLAVESGLRQTYANVQIIVSDNHSGDETEVYLDTLSAEARVLVLRQKENLGMVGNWNSCLHHADGEWFLLLSDDDYLEPDALQRMLLAAYAAPHPDKVGMVYCLSRTVDAAGKEISRAPNAPALESAEDFALAYFRRQRIVFPCSTLLRTEDLRALGGYRTDGVKLGCDAIAWSEAAVRRGYVACAPALLSNYRVHANNLTSTQSLDFWIHDLQVVLDVWDAAFRSANPARLKLFQRESRSYYTYFLATTLSQSGQGARGRWTALARFLRYGSIFRGITGRIHQLTGVARLLLPRAFEPTLRGLRQRLRRSATAGISWSRLQTRHQENHHAKRARRSSFSLPANQRLPTDAQEAVPVHQHP